MPANLGKVSITYDDIEERKAELKKEIADSPEAANSRRNVLIMKWTITSGRNSGNICSEQEGLEQILFLSILLCLTESNSIRYNRSQELLQVLCVESGSIGMRLCLFPIIPIRM